jgi:hypothetical protein
MLGAILRISASSATVSEGVRLSKIGEGRLLLPCPLSRRVRCNMLAGRLSRFSFWLLETFPWLSTG